MVTTLVYDDSLRIYGSICVSMKIYTIPPHTYSHILPHLPPPHSPLPVPPAPTSSYLFVPLPTYHPTYRPPQCVYLPTYLPTSRRWTWTISDRYFSLVYLHRVTVFFSSLTSSSNLEWYRSVIGFSLVCWFVGWFACRGGGCVCMRGLWLIV